MLVDRMHWAKRDQLIVEFGRFLRGKNANKVRPSLPVDKFIDR
jgi:hypothetical protein